jgi:fibronectin type 3 domain-containing protein
MLKVKSILVVSLLFVAVMGCTYRFVEVDTEPPAVPRGVISITGDQKVTIAWYPNHESDLSGYNLYRSMSENSGYFIIATTNQPQYVDFDVVNGQTYYYAVTAFDFPGNESELSYDLVRDNHFAKIRITNLTQDLAEIDWAYQIDPGNPELKANLNAGSY